MLGPSLHMHNTMYMRTYVHTKYTHVYIHARHIVLQMHMHKCLDYVCSYVCMSKAVMGLWLKEALQTTIRVQNARILALQEVHSRRVFRLSSGFDKFLDRHRSIVAT